MSKKGTRKKSAAKTKKAFNRNDGGMAQKTRVF